MSIPQFPIKVIFEDQSAELFDSKQDIEQNLEDFNSDTDVNCQVFDANGVKVRLIVALLQLVVLEYSNSSSGTSVVNSKHIPNI